MKNRIVFSMYLFCFLCTQLTLNAQKKQHTGVFLDKDVMGLKGPVHKVYYRFTYFKDSLPKDFTGMFKHHHDYEGKTFPYLEFTKEGLFKKTIYYATGFQKSFDFIDSKYDRITLYKYSVKDYNKKKNYKTHLDRNYGFSSRELLLNINNTAGLFSYLEKEIVNDSTEYNQSIYVYKYDKKGRISVTKSYSVLDIEEKNKIKPDNLYVTVLHTYDEKDRIIQQRVIGGPQLAFPFSFLDASRASLGEEGGIIKYKYDKLDRLTQIQFYAEIYGEREMVSQEDFTYHPTKGYILTKKKFVDNRVGNYSPTQAYLLTYNAEGDVIRRENFADDWYKFLTKKKLYRKYDPNYKEADPYQVYHDDVQNRYYKYEYDKYNNWIKCYLYMEDTPNGTPSAITERKIEYYN